MNQKVIEGQSLLATRSSLSSDIILMAGRPNKKETTGESDSVIHGAMIYY